MGLEGLLLHEGLEADVALVGPDAGVDQHVPLHVCLQRELPAADLTLELLHALWGWRQRSGPHSGHSLWKCVGQSIKAAVQLLGNDFLRVFQTGTSCLKPQGQCGGRTTSSRKSSRIRRLAGQLLFLPTHLRSPAHQANVFIHAFFHSPIHSAAIYRASATSQHHTRHQGPVAKKGQPGPGSCGLFPQIQDVCMCFPPQCISQWSLWGTDPFENMIEATDTPGKVTLRCT